MNEAQIISRENILRNWFTRDADPVLTEIDGLDIGWGGVQRWATASLPDPLCGLHLDFACGYGTFLAQLGWRFPDVRLIGLNIDFTGPHAAVNELLAEAEVAAALVQADARYLPFADNVFSSASCFLGLQDIEIGYGWEGVRTAFIEAVRVLQFTGILILLDEFSYEQFDDLYADLPIAVLDESERSPDVCWDRQIAERAIELYAAGWVAQSRPTNTSEQQRLYAETHARMKAEMERQLKNQDYYVPFCTIRRITLRK